MVADTRDSCLVTEGTGPGGRSPFGSQQVLARAVGLARLKGNPADRTDALAPGEGRRCMSAERATQTASPTGELPTWATVFAPLEREMIAYRRELPRLLEAGDEGRYALLKDDTLL